MIHNYRLVVMSDESLEERFSLKLNRLNIFVIGSLFVLTLVFLTATLIAFTPLKRYIPGYSSVELKRTAVALVYKADSLEQKLKINQAYIKSIKSILVGDIKMEEFKKDSVLSKLNSDNLKLDASAQDSVFRQEVALKDRFSIFEKASKKGDIVFFAPVKGTISDGFNLKTKHLAVDIVLPKGTPVKSIADGTVIFSEYTVETGYVLIIEHLQGYLSVYKHNSSVFKKQGDLVNLGEVIANSGSTGSITTGPHLHFELWTEGKALNPVDYIDFE